MSLSGRSPLTDAVADSLAAVTRVHVPLSDIERYAAGADASLMSSPDRRHRLASALDELAERGILKLPAAASWDRSRQPPLPNFVTVMRDRAPARRVSSRETAWVPELAWAAEARLDERAIADLLAVQRFLANGGRQPMVVPMRERSLELFGDEKRLDELIDGQLFREGRLTQALLRCRRVHPPFVHHPVGAGPWALVVENHDTYHSICELIPADGPVGTVIYGSGTHFQASVTYIADLPRRPERVLYFGDLDAAGLRIPMVADRVASKRGLPVIEAAGSLYRLLLELGTPAPARRAVTPATAHALASWLPLDAQAPARELLEAGERLAQEAVGLEVLSAHPAALAAL